MLRFLKPNLWNSVLTLALFALSGSLWRMYVSSRISDTFPHGFPFQFYVGWEPCRPGEICFEFNSLWLLLDILIWYLVGAFLMDRLLKRR